MTMRPYDRIEELLVERGFQVTGIDHSAATLAKTR